MSVLYMPVLLNKVLLNKTVQYMPVLLNKYMHDHK